MSTLERFGAVAASLHVQEYEHDYLDFKDM